MCAIASNNKCGPLAAYRLGLAHEETPKNPEHSKRMDLHNNLIGVNLAAKDKSIKDCLKDCETEALNYHLYWFSALPVPAKGEPPIPGMDDWTVPRRYPGWYIGEYFGPAFTGRIVPKLDGSQVPGWGEGSNYPPRFYR